MSSKKIVLILNLSILFLLVTFSFLFVFAPDNILLSFTRKKYPSITGQAKPSPIPYNWQEIFTDDQALFAYVQEYGPKQTMQALVKLSSSLQKDCHQNAHRAGRFAYKTYNEKAFSMCTPECQSGCYHGASEGYFEINGTANLSQNLNRICNAEKNSFIRYQCIHGVGHGLMSWSSYDLPEALHYCNLIESPEGCYLGVFMENIVGGLSADHKTTYLSSDPHYPCTIVDEKYKSLCYFYQTTRMTQLFGNDFSKVASECLRAEPEHQRFCFESMGRDVGGLHTTNSESAIKECFFAPYGDLRKRCLIGAVQNSFWDKSGEDTALQFCAMLTDKDEKKACYEMIFTRAKDILVTQENLKSFCQKAELPYQSTCVTYL